MCHPHKQLLQLACPTSSRGEGVFGWSAELYLVVVDRTFWEVILRLCVRAECEETDCQYTFLFSFKEWNSAGRGAVGVWGVGDSGWKGVFQLDTFHGCFGKQWWKQGRFDGPILPLGSLRCQSKERKRERASLVQHRMSSVYSVLTSEKTSLPQNVATVLLLQVHSKTAAHALRKCSRVAKKGR